MKIEVYTDGSATTRDKPGGWAYVLVIDGKKIAECGGYMPNASNNDAEMEAAIQGLAAVLKLTVVQETDKDEPAAYAREVTLCSDSKLIIGWASGRYRFKQQDK